MIDFIFHSFPCTIYNFYAFTVMHPSQKKDIELELELEVPVHETQIVSRWRIWPGIFSMSVESMRMRQMYQIVNFLKRSV